jgi:hypothetical protein
MTLRRSISRLSNRIAERAAYIVTNQTLQQLTISHVTSGRLVVLGGFPTLFSLITTFLLAVYTELRVLRSQCLRRWLPRGIS